MRIRLPLTVLPLACVALLAGCAAAPSSSGLTSANPANYAPPVFGSRAALSDPREQAATRAPAAEGKARAADAEPAPRQQRVATARVEPERAATPPASRHESVDTGRRKALDNGKETEKAKAGGRPRAEAAKPSTRPPAPPADGNVVEVAPGETLLKIANRHKVSVSALMSANRLASLTVEPGQRLVIPKR